ncbi:MAG: GWxTD domain-containing protein [candidate division KSB1 bacterium]|nr:GWxTD domain-containing protein [candidate division KSB1 bacterium]
MKPQLLTLFLTVFSLLVLIATGIEKPSAQIEMPGSQPTGVPLFYLDVANVASDKPNLSRLNLFLKIAFDELQFIKEEDKFKAQYEVSIVVFDEKGNQADGKIFQQEVLTNSYEATNSRDEFSFSNVSFDLNPSEYRFSVGLMDLDTKQTGFRKGQIKLRQFEDAPLKVSDIILASNIEVDSLGVKSLTPEIADHIRGKPKKLFAYYEIYTTEARKEVEVFYKVKEARQKVILSGSHRVPTPNRRTLDFIEIAPEKLSYGPYVFQLEIKEGPYQDSTEKPFFIRWTGLPSSISDLELAIKQLRYISRRGEMEKMEKAPKDEKLKLFKKFWNDRDPTPGTEVNEYMEEYYRRVEYANENFSAFREGWKTDMGMIYIIFGTPNDIERHPFERGYKPYEIWYYYNINRQFLFVDTTGFGEYRLATPYWEEWRSEDWRP